MDTSKMESVTARHAHMSERYDFGPGIIFLRDAGVDADVAADILLTAIKNNEACGAITERFKGLSDEEASELHHSLEIEDDRPHQDQTCDHGKHGFEGCDECVMIDKVREAICKHDQLADNGFANGESGCIDISCGRCGYTAGRTWLY
jgi:hypothetical protein